MKKLLSAVLAAGSLLGTCAQAEVQKAPPNGSQMVKLCAVEQGEVAEATCRGFVIGVIDITRSYATMKLLQPPFCIPREVAMSETIAVYKKYLEENRAIKHFPASALAVTAFKDAYPCE